MFLYNIGDVVLIKDYDEVDELYSDHNNIPREYWDLYKGIGRVVRITTTPSCRYYLLQNVYHPEFTPWFFYGTFFTSLADENERAQYDIEEGIL